MLESTLKLFRAVPVSDDTKPVYNSFKYTVRKGFVLDPRIEPTAEVINKVQDIVCTPEVNYTFFKSWEYIKDTPQETLFFHAVVHYLTTYGFKQLGIFSNDTVYIPEQYLNVPVQTSFVVVKAMTKSEIYMAITDLANSIALSEETIEDIFTLCKLNNWKLKCTNKELQAKINKHFNIIPQEPVEFLRHMVLECTGETLLIKNAYLIEKIKEANPKTVDALIRKAPKNLASIFYRFKPIFLAFKYASHNKTFFNKLRRDAVKQHKPMAPDFLNNVTAKLKHNSLDFSKLARVLGTAPLARKVRLANALAYRFVAEKEAPFVFKIRNGSSYVKIGETSNKQEVLRAYDLVVNSIAEHYKHIKVPVCIPENINYTIPATEKQYTGMFPTNTSVSITGDFVVGVHWYDVNERPTDLDFSVVSVSGKVGWNIGHKNDEVLYSGDMTTAPRPKGANEVFRFNYDFEDDYLLYLNYYNHNPEYPVPAKVFIAKAPNILANYMVDPNEIIACADIVVEKKQYILGFAQKIYGVNKVFFNTFAQGNTNVANSRNEHSVNSRKFLAKSAEVALTFKEVLKTAGVKVISEFEEGCIDLRPESLTKTSFLTLAE